MRLSTSRPPLPQAVSRLEPWARTRVLDLRRVTRQRSELHRRPPLPWYSLVVGAGAPVASAVSGVTMNRCTLPERRVGGEADEVVLLMPSLLEQGCVHDVGLNALHT